MNLDVILVNYNSGPLLKKCLDSIFSSRNIANDNVYVIDNGSNDNSIKYAQSFYTELKIIRNRENLGFARAVNQGMRISQSRYVLLLNPDAEIMPDGSKKMIEFMDKYDDCGVLGGLVLYPDGRRQETARAFPTLWTVIFGRRTSLLYRILPKNPFSKKYLLSDEDFSITREVDFVAGTFVMLRRQALNDIGFFDENFFFYVEDVDLCYRMKKQGWKVYFYPDARCVHLYGENIRKDNIHPEIYHAQGMYRFFNKHYHPKLIARLLLRIFLDLKIVQIIAWGFLKQTFVQ